MGYLSKKAGFRQPLRMEWGLRRMMVDFVLLVAEYVELGTTVWVHWCLRDEKEVRGVMV